METDENHKAHLFEAILDEVGDGIIIADEEFAIQSINRAAASLFGLDGKAILGRKLNEVFLFEINRIFLSKEQGGLFPKEGLSISFSSVNTSLKVNSFVRKIEVACEVCYLCLFTSSSIVEAKQKLDSNKYSRLFETSLEGVFFINNQGIIIDANPAACSIYQKKKEAIIGNHVGKVFPHKGKVESELIWENFLNEGKLEGFYKYDLGNGDFRYIDFKARANYEDGIHIAVFLDLTDQIKTEKALKTSESNLQAIFNNTKQQYILLDNDDCIVAFNKYAQERTIQLVGKKLEVGEYIFNYTEKEAEERYKNFFEKMRQGEIVYSEVSNIYNSIETWVEVGLIPVFDSRKSIDGSLLSFTDITNRKRAELNLSESEARFRSLVQNSSDIFIIIDKDSTIKYSSASIEKILGYREENLNGRTLLEFVHEDDKQVIAKTLQRISNGDPYNPLMEYRFLHFEGFYVFLETHCNNLLSNEHIHGIVLNTRDITERKYQEENLLLLERAIDSSSNGILISDPNQPDNPVIYVNKAFEQITGYNYFDIIGKNIRVLQKEDRDQPEIKELRIALKQHTEISVVLRNYKKDGSLFWNQLSISPVFNRNGDLANYIGVINDITEKKIVDDALLEITQGVSSMSGYNIYSSVVTHIGIRLKMDYVFVGEVHGDILRLKSLYSKGAIVENIDFPLKGMPCNEVIEKGVACFYENIQELFPEVDAFREHDVNSYMGVPLKDSSGNAIGVLGIMSEKQFLNKQFSESILNILSVRVSAELERDYNIVTLMASEQRFKDLAENSPDIVYMIDLEARKIVYFNRKEIFGYKAEELKLSEAWEKIVHPDDVNLINEHWSNFITSTGSGTQGVEYRLKSKSGVYEWVNNRHIVLERHPDGTARKVLLNITVITERKKAEEALRESQARLAALVENTNDIVWSVDKDLVFTTMNSSLQKIFHNYYNKPIAVGDRLSDVLPEAIREEWILLHNYVLEGKMFSVEFTIKGDTSDLSYEISYNPIYNTDGSISGVSVFGRDITERKSVENDIIKTNFELDSFVYRASHDLRAPLRSVLGLINLVREEDSVDERNRYLGFAEKSVNKLDSFISDLTDFSRNSRLEINPDIIDFNLIIEECLENLKYMDNADQIRTIINVTPNSKFCSDKTRINIILQNIISNSIKYLNQRINDSFVQLDIQITNEFADISIKDNGRGIREEYLDKIFNMFFRASQDSYGSGLGLYITKQVVEKLNGSISVYSVLGEGTRFEIRLPNLISGELKSKQISDQV